ncbi:MAG: hypothetical protein DMG16_15455 [Acidobacteria bacterium]|nr:MAG: hypothetical protein DMG16_15455 [Acidobacteriota bacterium]
MKIKSVFIALTCLVVARPLLAQEETLQTEKAANIERLLKVIGADQLQQSLQEQVLAVLKPLFGANVQTDETKSKILARFSEIMAQEFRKLDFTDISRELYDKYFTNDEIKGLIAFYETPVGRKAVQALPRLTAEAMIRGQELGQQASQKAFQRLIEEFPDLQKIMKAR